MRGVIYCHLKLLVARSSANTLGSGARMNRPPGAIGANVTPYPRLERPEGEWSSRDVIPSQQAVVIPSRQTVVIPSRQARDPHRPDGEASLGQLRIPRYARDDNGARSG